MVILDLDDTLCDLRSGIERLMHAQLGIHIPWTEWGDYELAGRYGLTPAEMLRALSASDVPDGAPAEPHAAACVSALRELGHQVGVVSARAWLDDGERRTRAWLRHHGIQPDFLKIVRNKGRLRGQSDPAALGKCEAIRPLTRGLGPVAAFVDDCAAHVRMVLERNLTRHGVIYDMPWNRDAATGADLHRIDELMQLPPLVGPAGPHKFVVRHR